MNRRTGLIILTLPLFLAWAAWGAGGAGGAGGAKTPAADQGAKIEPAITVRKNQRMLVVTMKGDPAKVRDKAMKILYGAFFRNATEAEKNMPIIPRVRWAFSAPQARKRDWIGSYALPISIDFTEPGDGTARIEDWNYGLVAEILHIGPYEKEAASIGILKDHIAANGFTISGDFEEEYLQGRGILSESASQGFSEVSPEAYRTILRYQVDNIQDFPKSYLPLSTLP